MHNMEASNGENSEVVQSVKKQENKKNTSILSEVFKDYCSSTSIHGIGYLGAQDKTLFEKIWWVLVFILSLIVCVVLICKTWTKWINSPVIVSFAQEQTPIWKIPFPAVTICPINKIKQTQYNYTEKFRSRANLTKEEHKKFWDVSLVCNLDYYDITQNGSHNSTDEEAIDNIIKVSPEISKIVEYSMWQYDDVEPDFFVTQLSEEGVCFTSNSLSQKDMFTDELNHDIRFINHDRRNEGWTIENGYPPGVDINTYPRRTAQDGYMAGLSIFLLTELEDMNHLCGFPVSGYKLIFHNPAELARSRQQYVFVPFNKEVTIAIKPDLITTSVGLLSTPARTRKCYFSHEKSLRFFKMYTQNNCKMECLANMTLHFCGCVPFYLPRAKNTPICGYGSTYCTQEMQSKILKYQMLKKENTISNLEKEKSEYEVFDKCDCLPSCSSLQFTTETSQADLHFIKTIELTDEVRVGIDDKRKTLITEGKIALTTVNIFFKDTQFLALHRSELYGQTDFLANCGGLLGLFMGFSFLSLLEIFYFLTIRIYYKLKRKREEATNL